MDNVIYPVIEYLEHSGNPYLGIIGVNGIVSDENDISILGFQPFVQDSDAVNIFNLIDEDLYKLFESCVIGSFSDERDMINIRNKYAISVTLRCNNQVSKENVISGLDKVSENVIMSLYPSVKRNKYLEYEAEAGSVMTLTSFASTIKSACDNVYQEINDIYFDGMSYRKDIGKL